MPKTDSDGKLCPDCGDGPFDSVANHIGHYRTDCTYPDPTREEAETLIGIWLVGGQIEENGDYPIMRKVSVNEEALAWLHDELGFWGNDVSVSQTGEEQAANLAQLHPGDYDSSDQYRLTVMTCPFLRELQNRDFSDVTLTAKMARILFSFRGHVHDRSAVAFKLSPADEYVELLQDAGYDEISVYEKPDGKNYQQVVLSNADSRRFMEWIDGPIPGFENKAVEMREQGNQGIKPSHRIE